MKDEENKKKAEKARLAAEQASKAAAKAGAEERENAAREQQAAAPSLTGVDEDDAVEGDEEADAADGAVVSQVPLWRPKAVVTCSLPLCMMIDHLVDMCVQEGVYASANGSAGIDSSSSKKSKRSKRKRTV